MEGQTKEVETLLGNPKKAMMAMSIPIIIATLVQNSNNIIDTIWVSGLGANALAAVGLVFPIFFIIISIGNGIGVGSSSAIARFLGLGDKDSADKTAAQSIVMAFVASIALSVILILFGRQLFELMGAGDAIEDCMDYAFPIFVSFPFVLISAIMSNLLRSEGDSKKAMYAQILGAVINICIDPFFIYDYGLGMGLAGAAWATAFAMMFSLALQAWWYWGKKCTYLKISFRKFRFDWELDKAILRVGFPASLEMLAIALSSMVLNVIVIDVAGTNGVAIYSSSWKIIEIFMIPIIGVGSAVVPVCAAAFGMRKFENIKTAYIYSIKIITIIVAIESVFVLLFAEQIVTMFTYDPSTLMLRDEMAYGIRISCAFLVLIPWGFVTAGMFQSLGMGVKSMIATFFRNFLMIPLCMIIATDMQTFWYGVVASEIIGGVLIGIWGLFILRYLMQGRYQPSQESKDSM